MKNVLKYTLPIASHVYFDFISYFSLGFFVMTMGEEYVVAMNPTYNTNSIIYATSSGISMTLMTLVCSEMGNF